MTDGDELPLVVPSTVDPQCDCVLVDAEAARAARPGNPAGPASLEEPHTAAGGSSGSADSDDPLCPPGYVPRQRPRSPYDLHGKAVVTSEPPEKNPEPPPTP